MKRILLATSAMLALGVANAAAADLQPRMVTKAPALAVWDWTGFYLGGYAGVGVNRSRSLAPAGALAGEIDHIGSGFTGGGTAGYNWQATRNIVLGVEGDIGYLGLGDGVRNFNESRVYDQQTSWIATLRGRLGWATGPNLSYVTAGAAFINVKDSIDSFAGGAYAESRKTLTGFTWGSGSETMLGGGWTAKSEYLYVSAGAGDALTSGGFPYQTDKHRYHLQRFGVNYLFGTKAQPALQQNNWTGAYGGIVFGTAASENRGTDPLTGLVGEFNNNASGYQGGAQLGYNYQFAPSWVAGVEGDIAWMGLDRTHIDYNDGGSLAGTKTSWVATARARLGYSTGPALLYVTGGGAWVGVKDNYNGFAGATAEVSKTLSGYTVGGGIETLLGGNWVSRSEYLYVDAGNGPVVTNGGLSLQQDHNYHLFRSSVTYKFGG